MSYSSDLYCDWDDRHGESEYEDALDAAQEEIVLSTLESIPDLTDDERENVRHAVWAVIDAAELEVDVTCACTLVEPGAEFWNAINDAVTKGLSYTRIAA